MSELRRDLTLFDTVNLVVGTIIGSGIFLVPAEIARAVHTPAGCSRSGSIGGVLTIFGALSLAELGAAMPDAGGIYTLHHASLRPASGVPVRLDALHRRDLGLDRHSRSRLSDLPRRLRAAESGDDEGRRGRGDRAPDVDQHRRSQERRARGQRAHRAEGRRPRRHGARHLPAARPGRRPRRRGRRLPCRPARCRWRRSASRSSPSCGRTRAGTTSASPPARSTIRRRTSRAESSAGCRSWSGLYLLANLAYLKVLTPAEIAASDRVALTAMTRVTGEWGGKLLTAAILCSILGAMNALILAGPRAYYQMAKDGLFLERVSRVHPRWRTPVEALVFQGLWSAFLVLIIGGFSQLFTYVIFGGWIFYALAVLSVIALRRKEPDLPRPFLRPRLSLRPDPLRRDGAGDRRQHPDRDAARVPVRARVHRARDPGLLPPAGDPAPVRLTSRVSNRCRERYHRKHLASSREHPARHCAQERRGPTPAYRQGNPAPRGHHPERRAPRRPHRLREL